MQGRATLSPVTLLMRDLTFLSLTPLLHVFLRLLLLLSSALFGDPYICLFISTSSLSIHCFHSSLPSLNLTKNMIGVRIHCIPYSFPLHLFSCFLAVLMSMYILIFLLPPLLLTCPVGLYSLTLRKHDRISYPLRHLILSFLVLFLPILLLTFLRSSL